MAVKNDYSTRSKPTNKRIQGVTLILNVSSKRNNTIVTVSDSRGNTICQSSGGCTEKGARKRTAHAAKEAGKAAAKIVISKKVKVSKVIVKIRGVGAGRESSAIGFHEGLGNEVSFDKVIDRTPIAHAGCRKRKAKRN